MNIEKLRARAMRIGTDILNAPDEDDVAALHRVAFPLPTPGATKTAELTLCRIALAARAVAEALGLSPWLYWLYLRAAALDPAILPHLKTEADYEAWKAMESRLLTAAFGPAEEDNDGGQR